MGGLLSNPYKINEPCCISLSGGRTSAFMLYKILEVNGGMPNDCITMFANTGREMPETLDFVRDIGDHWGVPIVWLELEHLINIGDKENPRFKRIPKVVTYETAARNGEPFKVLFDAFGAIPNRVARTCTVNLKLRTMVEYARAQGFKSPWLQAVGLRADEPRRAAKLHHVINEGQETYCPLYVDGVTASDVGAFWERQNFDLQLPNNNGVTDWGNCDLCFLKGMRKRLSIIRERPDLADWWIESEKYKAQQFCRNEPSYEQMKIIATTQGQLFEYDDETIPCFCGD